MKEILTLVFTSIISVAFAQHRNDIWCFGDSAGIDFTNLSNPQVYYSGVNSRGSCVSICDTNSTLLFYAYTRAQMWGNTTLVKNINHQVMQNGSNIVGEAWYMELIIIPNPGNNNQYYLFSVGLTGTSLKGLYYSVIDMSLNGGLGLVLQKNVQLMPYEANDGITAIKHGNGRDWWLLHKKNGLYAGWLDNRFYKYLITPVGVNFVDSLGLGGLDNTNIIRYKFNKEGNKLARASLLGNIETYDFDRCTGVISNCVQIRADNSAPYPGFFGAELSASGRFLYIMTSRIAASYLIQVDLQNPTPWQNADTLWMESSVEDAGGLLQRGPDDKIYLTCEWNDGWNSSYPYPDSAFYTINTYLSVINSPDSLGLACDFQPYSFYLGGARTYWGLPNNPDYDLPRLQGSVCDTVMWTAINSPAPRPPKGEEIPLHVFYHTEWQIAFINASGLKGRNCLLEVFDVAGKKVFETGGLSSPFGGQGAGCFTFDLSCAGLANGMYLISLSTEKEKMSGKFVKE